VAVSVGSGSVCSDDDVLAVADRRQMQAHRILARLRLLQRWSEIGTVQLVGSVVLNVVVRPDIDLEIYVDELLPRPGFAALVPLADEPGVRRIRYTDARYPRPMEGLYWKLEVIDDDESWTIDNWMFTRDRQQPAVDTTEAVAEAIRCRPSARATIVRIKQQAAAADQRAFGRWLYEAVLTAQVETYDEYLAWMGDQDPFERSIWHP
jgi:hypothetical protein